MTTSYDYILAGSGLAGLSLLYRILKERMEPEQILAFLANESSFWEEFKIRNSVPQLPFIVSGMKQLFGLGNSN